MVISLTFERDVHMGKNAKYPCAVEIVGRAIKVGDAVKTVKVGDRVGVGAQIYA